jgi:hypothetical protein
MKSPNQDSLFANSNQLFTPAMRKGLAMLLRAHDAAAALDRPTRDFALELLALTDGGIDQTELRILICHGLAEHLVESAHAGAKVRRFRRARSTRMSPASCFTLSEHGLAIARTIRADESDPPHELAAPKPFWDHDRHELRVDAPIVKRFRRPAKNQETILDAFQEDGWPPRIDDPLPGNAHIDRHDRLHDAVKKLNRQKPHLVAFNSDGAGMGVLWVFRDRTRIA